MKNDLINRSPDVESQEDYRAMADLFSYAYPEEQINSIGLKISDRTCDRKYTCERNVAERGGRIAEVGCFEHWESFYHPHKYLLHVIVPPDYQKNSIGHAVYRYT